MKIRLILFSVIVFGITSCSQHVCPTYENSAIKYHHHAQNHTHH